MERCVLHQCINIAYIHVHQIIVISFKVPGVDFFNDGKELAIIKLLCWEPICSKTLNYLSNRIMINNFQFITFWLIIIGISYVLKYCKGNSNSNDIPCREEDYYLLEISSQNGKSGTHGFDATRFCVRALMCVCANKKESARSFVCKKNFVTSFAGIPCITMQQNVSFWRDEKIKGRSLSHTM